MGAESLVRGQVLKFTFFEWLLARKVRLSRFRTSKTLGVPNCRPPFSGFGPEPAPFESQVKATEKGSPESDKARAEAPQNASENNVPPRRSSAVLK